LPDIKRALEQKSETLVFGTGAYGAAEVTQKLQDYLKQQGVEYIIDKTKQAVKTFNRLIKQKSQKEQGRSQKVIGLFHLTC